MAADGWIRTHLDPPPPGEMVLGWDVFYSEFHLVVWDGRRRDDEGFPFPVPLDDKDDLFIEYWRPLPDPPC